MSQLHNGAPTAGPGQGGSGSPPKLLLDEVDGRILRELLLGEKGLFRSERTTFEEISKKIKLHRNTVAARARRMEEAGAFLPLSVTVDPGQFGLLRGTIWVAPPADHRSEEVLSSLWLVEGLQCVVQYLEGWLVFLFGEDEPSLRARAEMVQHLCGGARATWETQAWRDYESPPPLAVNATDLGMIRLLLKDARLPLPEVARALGVSARTVERRFDRMVGAGAIMVIPSGTGRYSGLLFGHLRVELEAPAGERARTLGELDRRLPQAVFRNLRHPRFASWIVFVPTVGDLEHLATMIRGIPGVRSVGVRLFLAFRLNPRWPDWLNRTLQHQLDHPARPRT